MGGEYKVDLEGLTRMSFGRLALEHTIPGTSYFSFLTA